MIDLDRIRDGINAFWLAWADVIIAIAGVSLIIVFALVLRHALRATRSTPRSRLIAGVAFLLGLGWEAEGQYEVIMGAESIDIPPAAAAVACFVFAAFLIQAYYQAEDYRRAYGVPGPAGTAMWVIALAGAGVASSGAADVTEFLLRMSVPVLAVAATWRVLKAPRADDSDEVKARRREDERRKRATWAVSWRSVLIWAKLMRPESVSESDAERTRRVRRMAELGDAISTVPPGEGGWPTRWRRRRLRALTRQATKEQITEARQRVEHARRAADIIAYGAPVEAPPKLTPWTGAPATLDAAAIAATARQMRELLARQLTHPDGAPKSPARHPKAAPRRATKSPDGAPTSAAVEKAFAAWRAGQPGLSIKAAASAHGAPETSLRRRINGHRHETKES